MNSNLGLLHFWQQGDLVTHGVALILVLLSIVCWSLTISRFIQQLRVNRSMELAPQAFWQALSPPEALSAIKSADSTGIFFSLARSAVRTAQAHSGAAERSLGAGVNLSESLTRALRNEILHAQASMESGLTFLASVGATAPFIGLFGTVWGIYHALVALSGASQVVLDKVAGPVGEALIMTAGGLFVAIPAVLAYNALTRGNRLVLAQLDGFAHDLHAYLTTGARRDMKPETMAQSGAPTLIPRGSLR